MSGRYGYGYGFARRRRSLVPAAPFSAVAAGGAQATVASPIDLSLTPAAVNRAAFNATGNATTVSDTVRLTKRIRKLFPQQADPTDNLVALSEYVCAADVINGAVNNSTRISPKPVVTWGMVDRTLVGNTINWEITGFHWSARLGRQLACVWVRATDGTNTTAWQVVNTVTLSNSCETPFQPECFAGALDITALNNDATITLQARAFPHFGVSASIADTTTETEYRFSNRFFYKNTGLFAAPNIISVSSTGTDATAVVSTNRATSQASPALTVGGAIGRAATLLGSATANTLSGLRVEIMDGVSMGSVPFGTYRMDGAAIFVTRAPGTNRATANATWSAAFRLWATANSGAVTTENSIIFDDGTITRTANVEFLGEGARRMHAQLRNVNFNWSSTAATNLKTNAHISIFGMTVTNYIGGLSFVVGGDNRMLRGLSGSFNNTAIEGYCIIGCDLNAARIEYRQCQRGALIYNNHLPDPPGAGNASIYLTTASDGQDFAGIAVVQNLAPMLKTGGQVNLRISGDSDFGNLTHAVIHHNTTPGDDIEGRWNIVYDETALTARTHAFVSCKGNVGPQLNSKPRDTFLDLTVTPGNFDFHHGTGCAGNYTEDIAPNGLDFNQAYGGIGSVIGGGSTLFVDDRAVSLPGPVAGSAGGNYRLQAGSPARDLFSEYLLAFDIAGAARPTSGTVDAGVYA